MNSWNDLKTFSLLDNILQGISKHTEGHIILGHGMAALGGTLWDLTAKEQFSNLGIVNVSYSSGREGSKGVVFVWQYILSTWHMPGQTLH